MLFTVQVLFELRKMCPMFEISPDVAYQDHEATLPLCRAQEPTYDMYGYAS